MSATDSAMPPPPEFEVKRRYKRLLVEFMTFRDQQDYDRATEFTPDQLATIKPADVRRWMCVKVYGNPDPGPEDNPTMGRASSLEYYKKALSYYMVNSHEAWNETALIGNPTRSKEVINLIKLVKQKEANQQGKASKARHPSEPIDVAPDALIHVDVEGQLDGGGDISIHDDDDVAPEEIDFATIYAQNMALRSEVRELKTELQHFQDKTARNFTLLRNSIRQISAPPPAAGLPTIRANTDSNAVATPPRPSRTNNNAAAAAAAAAENQTGPAILSRLPRDLHALWREYDFGIEGNKAAKWFSATERGKVKYIYTRRKIVWDQVTSLMRAGYTAQTAVNRIYEVHGRHKSVTWIINQMRKNRQSGENPIFPI